MSPSSSEQCLLSLPCPVSNIDKHWELSTSKPTKPGGTRSDLEVKKESFTPYPDIAASESWTGHRAVLVACLGRWSLVARLQTQRGVLGYFRVLWSRPLPLKSSVLVSAGLRLWVRCQAVAQCRCCLSQQHCDVLHAVAWGGLRWLWPPLS